MTAEFWEYDTRLGRRWNVDPVVKEFESSYGVFRNNPIVLKDPNGNEVINGDQIKANEKKELRDSKVETRNVLMNNLKINESTTKRDFLKSGGTKENWRMYKDLTNEIKNLNNEVSALQVRADITSEIIKKWSEESSSTFREVNSQKIDFILYSRDYSGKGYLGKNNIISDANGIDFTPYMFEFYGKPAISVAIDQDVNISTKDASTGQFSLNHEAGHFIYIVQNPKKYFEYISKLKKEGIDFNGGHNDDDESGNKAKEYGNRK